MTFRPRAVIVQVVLDQIDEQGQVVDEATSQPIKLFPGKWASLEALVEELAVKATNAAIVNS